MKDTELESKTYSEFIYLLYTSPVNSATTGVSRNKVGLLENVPIH